MDGNLRLAYLSSAFHRLRGGHSSHLLIFPRCDRGLRGSLAILCETDAMAKGRTPRSPLPLGLYAGSAGDKPSTLSPFWRVPILGTLLWGGEKNFTRAFPMPLRSRPCSPPGSLC